VETAGRKKGKYRGESQRIKVIKAIKVILSGLMAEGSAAGPTGSNPIKAIKVILSVLTVEGLAPGPTGSNPIF
jgi:hypothetical protein